MIYFPLEIMLRLSNNFTPITLLSAMNDVQRWTGSHNSVAISSPLPLTTIIILCNIVYGKEPSHSEYYCCTVVTAVCTCEI